jgi:hypothetical protein
MKRGWWVERRASMSSNPKVFEMACTGSQIGLSPPVSEHKSCTTANAHANKGVVKNNHYKLKTINKCSIFDNLVVVVTWQ